MPAFAVLRLGVQNNREQVNCSIRTNQPDICSCSCSCSRAPVLSRSRSSRSHLAPVPVPVLGSPVPVLSRSRSSRSRSRGSRSITVLPSSRSRSRSITVLSPFYHRSITMPCPALPACQRGSIDICSCCRGSSRSRSRSRGPVLSPFPF